MTIKYEEIHRDVIESCMKGDVRAQYQLYSLYSKAMYNICYRMTGQQEEAEDMLQESFSYAFRKLGSFRFESSFGAWLKRIVVNTCINHLKKRKVDLVYTDQHNDPAPDDDFVDYGEIRLRAEGVMKAMGKLSQGYRIVFSLYLLEGYDHKEISEIMGISESTSKSQFLRAKQKIKEILMSHE
ncbi:MAG: RNA polymerase sigma factor [Bacteroidales bacterium]|nr:RNA polymerase sigma factor [Bacteroidales bacterium]